MNILVPVEFWAFLSKWVFSLENMSLQGEHGSWLTAQCSHNVVCSDIDTYTNLNSLICVFLSLTYVPQNDFEKIILKLFTFIRARENQCSSVFNVPLFFRVFLMAASVETATGFDRVLTFRWLHSCTSFMCVCLQVTAMDSNSKTPPRIVVACWTLVTGDC